MSELKILKENANCNIHDILDILEIPYTDKYVYLNGPCPVHGGDNREGWSWHIQKGVWQCYTNGCHEEYDCDIYGLIMAIKELTFVQAKNWLVKSIGQTSTREEAKEILDQVSNREFINQTMKATAKSKIYDRSCLSKLSYHDYLEGRGYPKDLIQKYQAGVGSGNNRYMSHRLIFPIINMSGEIIGFTGRTLIEDYEERKIPKWKHNNGYQSSQNLFNINFAAPYIRDYGTVILVEGPLDVLRLEQYGIHNSVALFGKSLHKSQMTLLMSVPCDNIKFALDADTAGRSGVKKGMMMARALFGVQVAELPEGKDCGDLTAEEAREIFNENLCEA